MPALFHSPSNYALILALLSVAAAKGETTFDGSVQPFLAKNCYACHNAKLASGRLNLESYKSAASVAQDRERWEHIVHKLETGEMPPKGLPRPDQAEVNAVTKWVQGEFEKADRLVKPDPGHVTARRLNRAEYNNTVRDLLGVDLRPADNFPQDDSGYGFDNIGDVLSLSPVLLERYLSAAEKVTRAALFGPESMKPAMVRYQPPFRRRADGTAGGSFKGPASFTITNYDFTGLTMPSAIHITHWFPVNAEYLFRCTPAGQRPGGSELIRMAVWIDGKIVKEIDVHPLDENGPVEDISGQTRELRTRVSAGEHWVAVTFLRQFDGLPAEYGGLNPTKRPPPPPMDLSFLKPPAGATPEQLEEFNKKIDGIRHKKLDVNNIRFDNVEIGGPYNADKGPSPESLKRIYVCGHLDGHHVPGCDRKILTNFARRAYRRPPTAEEVNKLVSLVALAQKQGDSFEEGIALAIEAALVSPQFLFRIERDTQPVRADSIRPINDYELASRLSYFLWSSTPDEELLHRADDKSLRKPEVLEAQVRRMLKDPKSHALVQEFGGQWLEFRALESVKPDRDKFPDFEDYLRMSMRTETEMFFESIVREDRSILDLIDGKYTFLNERLAQLYKSPGVTGPDFRRVDLTGNPERGGILTQASVLTVSSYATRTSPVLRGKWILENVLNAPPPPPPPNVPVLDEAAVGTSGSLRQQLEKHRANATCASCHSRMDPLGFGLENYDAIGAWRSQDGKFAIDSSGTLPDGRTFEGPEGLKKILMADRDRFAECVTEKLLTYALGRGLERYDRPAIKTITSHLAAHDYRFSSLVMEIVNSLPFQMQRGDRAKT
jgi:mono/diheme cytochrome c family protein